MVTTGGTAEVLSEYVVVMVVSVTVENAVDTGVCTHVDILSFGHLLQTINNRGERRNLSKIITS